MTQSEPVTIVLYAPGAWEYFNDCRDIEENGKRLSFVSDGKRITIYGTWSIQRGAR